MRQKLCNNLQYTLNLFYKGQSYFQLVVSPKFLDKLSSFVPYLSLIIYYVCLTTNPILDPFGHINWSEISKFMLKSLKIGQVNQSCPLDFWKTWVVSISVPYSQSLIKQTECTGLCGKMILCLNIPVSFLPRSQGSPQPADQPGCSLSHAT